MKIEIHKVEGGYTIHTFDLDKSPAITDHVRATLKETIDLVYETFKKEEA